MDLPGGSRYMGEVNGDGEPHGHGVEEWSDRRRYVGEFSNGHRYGRGVYTLPEGDCYEFIFCRFPRGGSVEGCGAYTREDGRRYVGGKFRGGELTEEGVMTWPDRTCFVGKFCDGVPAEGVMTEPDGTMSPIREGNWHGQGAYVWPHGSRYVGEIRDGKPNGQGVVTYMGGERCEGEFLDGDLVGPVDEACRD